MAQNLRPIVIDGCNVAITHGNKEVFSCRGIKICVDYFKSRGHNNVTAFVPMRCKESFTFDYPIKEKEILFQLESEQVLVFTPSRSFGGKRIVCHDDLYVLNLASQNDGVVVSNDTYRDLINRNPKFKKVVEERLLMYSFVNDIFMPPDDPLGRHGPSLDVFLTITQGPLSPNCPYGRKCTYGSKCKYNHPERGNQPYKTVTERLLEEAYNKMLEDDANGTDSKEMHVNGKAKLVHTASLPPNLPLYDNNVTKTFTSSSVPVKKIPLHRTKHLLAQSLSVPLDGKKVAADEKVGNENGLENGPIDGGTTSLSDVKNESHRTIGIQTCDNTYSNEQDCGVAKNYGLSQIEAFINNRNSTLKTCPFGKKCIYGNRCKYFHPERCNQHLKAMTERLLQELKILEEQAKNVNIQKKVKIHEKAKLSHTASLPPNLSVCNNRVKQPAASMVKKTPLHRTKNLSVARSLSLPLDSKKLAAAQNGTYNGPKNGDAIQNSCKNLLIEANRNSHLKMPTQSNIQHANQIKNTVQAISAKGVTSLDSPRSSISNSIPINCPYGKKCTYGHKCKYNHPERCNQPYKIVTERIVKETCDKMVEILARNNSISSLYGHEKVKLSHTASLPSSLTLYDRHLQQQQKQQQSQLYKKPALQKTRHPVVGQSISFPLDSRKFDANQPCQILKKFPNSTKNLGQLYSNRSSENDCYSAKNSSLPTKTSSEKTLARKFSLYDSPSNLLRLSPPICPYGNKCTYGNKCKFYHPERANQPSRRATERLLEGAYSKVLQAQASQAVEKLNLQEKSKLTHTASLPPNLTLCNVQLSSPSVKTILPEKAMHTPIGQSMSYPLETKKPSGTQNQDHSVSLMSNNSSPSTSNSYNISSDLENSFYQDISLNFCDTILSEDRQNLVIEEFTSLSLQDLVN